MRTGKRILIWAVVGSFGLVVCLSGTKTLFAETTESEKIIVESEAVVVEAAADDAQVDAVDGVDEETLDYGDDDSTLDLSEVSEGDDGDPDAAGADEDTETGEAAEIDDGKDSAGDGSQSEDPTADDKKSRSADESEENATEVDINVDLKDDSQNTRPAAASGKGAKKTSTASQVPAQSSRSANEAEKTSLDKTHKTGAGFGNDSYLLFAGIFGLGAAAAFVVYRRSYLKNR